MELKKKFHLLWNTATKEILVDYEATNPLTVTYCTRPGIEGADFDDKENKDKKISDEKLKKKEIEGNYGS
jgi:hypothetical protein